MPDQSLACPLRFQHREAPRRRGEPVTVGLPWPRGAIKDDRCFRLLNSESPLQTKVLDRWGDGSIRWCLFDFFAGGDEAIGIGEPRVFPDEAPNRPQAGSTVLKQPDAWDIRLADGRRLVPENVRSQTMVGPVRSTTVVESDLGLREVDGPFERLLTSVIRIEQYPGIATLKVTATLTNSQPAEHPGGNWDLGMGGRIEIASAAIVFPKGESSSVQYSLEIGQPFQTTAGLFELSQESSGGPNWNSTNHLNAKREIAPRWNGYRVRSQRSESGQRATPIVMHGRIGLAVPEFWEQFPKAITVGPEEISLGLFPVNTAGPHELQGGEQKTHVFFVSWDRDTITDEPMAWCRSPAVVHADPEWYAASGAVPYLTPSASDPHQEYLSLVQQALDGPDTFEAKRETIDEYGWRHFGDIYGDHEAVKHTGPTPMISHYNNQYDCVQAFLIQFFRSGDARWLTQGRQCADHTVDIDIYHTKGDKAAYNGGLFWHTYHYVDADTGTHRSYPKSLRKGPNVNQTERVDQLAKTAEKLQKAYAVGGGPSSSHNYNAGLATMYFLTGDERYHTTAIDLADFVWRMEDPRSTPFRFLSRESTGLATDSGGGGYHGPGRASANSILALVTGHRLTGDLKYLKKAEALIRRVCSPKQDLDRLDLLNAELRWFYTMHLQALGVYLDHKIELGQLDENYAYAQATLLHYARWMAEHERPILDRPERLQFPTETWAAQDFRKVEVFQFAAKHATGELKAKCLERAAWFFQTSVAKLHTFPTKSLCRPVILSMKYGWTRNWWLSHADEQAPPPTKPLNVESLPPWQMFVPQRVLAVKRAKRIVLAGAAAGLMAIVTVLGWWFNR